MAKTSAVQKNLKRIKLVKKFAKKRAALKKIINDKKLELSERFEAQLKLNKLPKNSKIKIRNPAFEFIPKKYIKGIVSEYGILSYSEFLKKVKL